MKRRRLSSTSLIQFIVSGMVSPGISDAARR
jgi:hypothetical protein